MPGVRGDGLSVFLLSVFVSVGSLLVGLIILGTRRKLNLGVALETVVEAFLGGFALTWALAWFDTVAFQSRFLPSPESDQRLIILIGSLVIILVALFAFFGRLFRR